MSSPERILTAVRALEPQLPLLIGEGAASVQSQIALLMEEVAAGRANGDALLQILSAYPAITRPLQKMLDLQQPVDDAELREIIGEARVDAAESYGLDDLMRGKSPYERLPGLPQTVVAGKKYICPVPKCTEEWFRVGLRSPKLCEEHGVVMVPAVAEG